MWPVTQGTRRPETRCPLAAGKAECLAAASAMGPPGPPGPALTARQAPDGSCPGAHSEGAAPTGTWPAAGAI